MSQDFALNERKKGPHFRGAVRVSRDSAGNVVGFRALLPRHLSKPPANCKNPLRYQQQIGRAFATEEEARAALYDEIVRLRNGGASRRSELPPEGPGVYVIQGAGRFLKIGRAMNVRKRMRSLQTNHPTRLRFLGLLSRDVGSERLFLDRFSEFKVNGEWFKPARMILDALKEARL